MTRAFLSYSRKDESAVVSLERDLKEFGLDVWIDRELTGGQAWWDRILERICGCECFLLALSPNSLDSEACKRESAYAAALGKPILPVLLKDGVATKLLPRTLSAIQFVDYRQQDKHAFIALTRALGGLPEPDALPEPLPDPPPVPISYLSDLSERVGTAETLSFDQQSALLVELKDGLRSQDDVDEVHQLLRELRKRGDLLARVAREIDELLGAPEPRSGVTSTRTARPAPQRAPKTPVAAPQPSEVVELRDATQRINDLVTYIQQEGGCWEVRADHETRVVLMARAGRCVARAHYGAYLNFKSVKLQGMGWRQDLLRTLGEGVTIVVIALTLGLLLFDERVRLQLRRKSVRCTWNLGDATETFEIAQTVASTLRLLAPTAPHYALAESTEQDEVAWWETYLPER